jgi:CheY-like chemotaxis protein
MPEGGTVTISAGNVEIGAGDPLGLPPGKFVHLAVSDDGTGIAPEVIEKVLEPFFTTKELGKGSGLGLSMVYGFAKQSDGAFRIDSELGEGTTAALWLPRAPAGSRVAADKVDEPERKRGDTRSLRILLVDDHPEVRDTTAVLLEEFGHHVTKAANGIEALERLKSGHCTCDLVISDYAMPNLSGTEFLRQVRELCPGIPALIITGYAEKQSLAEGLDGVEVLLKPFTPSALEAAIGRISETEATAA